jgi:dolichyl-phosphate beta-glucosyltransferase
MPTTEERGRAAIIFHLVSAMTALLDLDSPVLPWLVLSLLTCATAYIFYPALVAAAAPILQSDEIPMPSSARQTRSTEASASSSSSLFLSLVIPAYNEELRLEIMLREAYDYLSQTDCPALQRLTSQGGRPSSGTPTVEWILVDDGSSDETTRVYEDFCRQSTNSRMVFRLLRLRRNAGKGAAVQTGILAAGGAYCLMVDADGATAFGPGLEAVAAFATSYDVVLGSRAQLQSATGEIQRSRLRRLLQAAFHALVVVLVGTAEIQDTQCGFKLFSKRVVRPLFGNLHLRRWAFDTELVVRATALGLRLQEVGVPWHEVEGSKLHTGPCSLVQIAASMLRDMICVRLCYSLRIWPLPVLAPRETDKDR